MNIAPADWHMDMSLTDRAELAELNSLLEQAGKLAEKITRRGSLIVVMDLWDAERVGAAVKGRLQWNCASARLYKTT